MDNQQQGICITLNGIELKQIDFAKDYFVSRCGRVYSNKTKDFVKLKSYHNKGYISVKIVNDEGVRKGYLVHRLVAMAYTPNPDRKPFVNHINGNKADNSVENLEWCTAQENMDHAYAKGLVKSYGEFNPRNKLTEAQVLEIYHKCLGDSQRKIIADEHGIDEATLSDIISRRNWSYLTKDLPDVTIRSKGKNFSEDEIRLICTMLQNKEKSSKIYDAIGRDRLTKYRLFDIKNRRVYQNISKDYIW